MPQFKVGNAGKSVGTKNLCYFKITYWLDLLAKEWPDLTANQRAGYSVELTKLLVNKAKALPIDPNDSKLNADEALAVLKSIETKASISTDASVTTIADTNLNKKL